ncbi:MAG: HEPN domain-containing protein [Bacteroidales bacterium]|nr:HEPN domain-containing protein [Bacteroidales bacterium]
MTDFYDDNSRNDLTEYRCQRSKNALDEAKLLFENGYYNGAISKLYYAAFYAASALMLKNKLKLSKRWKTY